ncbi:unnamed protein product, partial [marine sediment metagenome]
MGDELITPAETEPTDQLNTKSGANEGQISPEP